MYNDIRHVIIADFYGNVLEIYSRAKRQWPREIQKQFSGFMAVIIFGISEKVQDIAGEIGQIIVNNYNNQICKVLLHDLNQSDNSRSNC